MSSDKRVKLNVGGQIFETSVDTLISSSVYFSVKLSRHNYEDELFIDRDPKIFSHILSYLRDSRYPFPNELKYEFDYYGISYGQTNGMDVIKDIDPEKKVFTSPVEDINMQKWDSGYFIPIVATGPMTEPSDDIPCSYIQKLKEYNCKFPSKSCKFVTSYDIIHTSDNNYSASLSCLSDMIIDVKLYFKIKNNVNIDRNTRYQLFDYINFYVYNWDYSIQLLSCNQIEILDKLNMSTEQKNYNYQMDKTGNIIMTIPFYWYKKSVFLTVDEKIKLSIKIKNASNIIDISESKLVTTCALLRHKVRCNLKTDDTLGRSIVWDENFLKIKETSDRVMFKASSTYPCTFYPVTEFIFALKNSTNKYLPIKSIKLYTDDGILLYMNGCVIQNIMAMEYNIMLDEPIYYYKFDENIDFVDRLSVMCEVVFYEKLSESATLHYYFNRIHQKGFY